MAKIDVSKVAEILKKNQLEPAVLRRIIEELNLVAQPDPGDELKPPPVKKQFVILVSDPRGRLAEKELTGWVLQIPEDKSPLSLLERLSKAAYDFNASKRGRALPVKTIGEALESVPAKFTKEVELWVKTKLPVQVLITDNILPSE
jgi:hypothetical protein